ncbi:hypothetical protein Leryth_005152 [Lithospermum erythrorhizon]|nr:hypothetical protein Leryth_005152 [Lithospermum erythrorhizon]
MILRKRDGENIFIALICLSWWCTLWRLQWYNPYVTKGLAFISIAKWRCTPRSPRCLTKC